MNAKGRPELSELKVGIFVIVSCAILAVAIFTLGTQVGLFEKTFEAKTYLNNVSGLKPGDIVLLGGIEVGNVRKVEIARELPDTPVNRRSRRQLEELNRELVLEEAVLTRLESEFATLRKRFEEAISTHGLDSAPARSLEEGLRETRNQLNRQESQVQRIQRSLDEARSSLQNIEVHMQILAEYRDWIRSDSSISLGSVGLLGDKYIEISLGRTPDPPPSTVETVSRLWGDREREVVLITGTEHVGFQELITGADDILVNFTTLSDKLIDIMTIFDEAEGTVGKFFADPSFYDNLNSAVVAARATVEEASHLMHDITQGPGTVPLLIQERELYDKIAASADRLESMATTIEEGHGTLGRLVNDPALYERTEEMMAHMEAVTRRLETGEGTVGRLFRDERVYQDLQRSLDKMADFLEGVEEGKGTLGRLAKDEQLYQNLNEVSSEVIKLLYDFRQNPREYLTIRFQLF